MPQGRSASLPFDTPQSFIERIVYHVEKAIVGKRESIESAVVAFLCGGHILLEDVPGVGKTMLVRALAKTVGASFKRIQCTPDLLPSDVTGVSIYNQKTGQFEFRPGPVMANVVLADEMNRASPKTQSALLEAMEEKQLTVDGETYRLPEPFVLLATQNPIEHEGTFPLPEAQLDRFLLKIRLGYPEETHEVDMLGRLQDRHPLDEVKTVLLREEWASLQRDVRQVHVEDTLKQYIVRLLSATRAHPDVALGASPRASFALMRVAQAKAYCAGRGYVVPDDIKSMAVQTIAHRLVLHPDARYTGKTAEAVVKQLIASVPVPAVRAASGGSL
ncbi:AAA family ATPase [Paenibacillus flagellatus]|uniref:Magnesium chelatase n=1 Tax=Paenibacillus flagellatus TaxID=2211139 RepID=A0A2V5JVU7_9BACL|nr:MoxR family ATPase [Paenibacillus flagellatus]PYI50631.1 magnesium chelatase [Paenibacillus flagellatus]